MERERRMQHERDDLEIADPVPGHDHGVELHPDDEFLDRVEAVADVMIGHVKDEESMLFPKVEEMWSDDMQRRVGDELGMRFEELVSGGPAVSL